MSLSWLLTLRVSFFPNQRKDKAIHRIGHQIKVGLRLGDNLITGGIRICLRVHGTPSGRWG
jgi:hypothetical protein